MEIVEATQAKLIQCIQDSLSHFLIDNAIFLAERLYAMNKSDYNLNVIGTCYYRKGKPQKTYSILKPYLTSPENRYLFSLSCYDIGKYKEAEVCLLSSSEDLFSKNIESSIPNGAAGLLLLGKIYEKRTLYSKAIHALRLSLKLNPFLFESFQLLCELGIDDDPNDYFQYNSTKSTTSKSNNNSNTFIIPNNNEKYDFSNSRTICSTPMFTPMIISGSIHHIPSPSPNVTPFLSSLSKSSTYTITPNKSICFTPLKTPSTFIEPEKPCTPLNNPKSKAPKPKTRKSKRNVKVVLFPEETPNKQSNESDKSSLKFLQTPKNKDSSHSLTFQDDSTPLNTTSLDIKPIFPSSIISSTNTDNNNNNNKDEITVVSEDVLKEGGNELLSLLYNIALGYQHICQFRCNKGIKILSSLPKLQYETGWILTQIGRAYLELAEYTKGKTIFEKIRQLEPYRMEGMELYSTILWYLRQQIDVSYLAHELVEFDKFAPESWCAVGNCFSLQNDHSTALKIFKRAIQVQPKFVYAYTLSGHEYMAIDDLEKAAVCFRNAIQINERHYNAWYGLGMIYFRQEQLDLALYHFVRAVKIHPNNSVLHYHISMVYHSQQDYNKSLKSVEKAIELCPTNNMAIFQKARCLCFLQQYKESLELLKDLNDKAPKQAKIYYAMGRLYKLINPPNIDEALKALSIAMDLDSQNSNVIKVALERINQEEDNITDDIFDLS